MSIKRVRLSTEYYAIFNTSEECLIYNSYDDIVCKLKKRESILLHHLLHTPNIQTSFDKLCEAFWGQDYDSVKELYYKSQISTQKKKLIETLSEILGDDITQKGNNTYLHFLTTGNEYDYRIDINPEKITYSDQPQYSFNENYQIEPNSYKKFIHRKEITSDIDGVLNSSNRIVFLTGFAGMGKSELARQYAKESKAKRKYTICIESYYHAGTNSFAAVLENTDKTIITEYMGIAPQRLTYEKLRLFSTARDDVLLILHDFDTFDSYSVTFLQDMLARSGTAHILITSRLREDSGIEMFGEIISLDKYKDKQVSFAADIFIKYAGLDNSYQKEATSIISLINGHTLMSSLLGTWVKQRIKIEHSTHTILNSLLLSVSNNIKLDDPLFVLKDGAPQKNSPFEILKKLFDNVLEYHFSEMERYVLGYVHSFFPQELKSFCEGLGDLPEESGRCNKAQLAVYSLYQKGMIEINEQYGISIHPLLEELVLDRNVSITNAPIAKQDNMFLVNLNSFVIKNSIYEYEILPRSFPDKKSRNDYAIAIQSKAHWFHLECMDSYFSVDRTYLNHRGYYTKEDIIQCLHNTIGLFPHLAKLYNCPGEGMLHPYFFFIAECETGRGLFIHDLKTGMDLCVINASEQRLPKNRYTDSLCIHAPQSTPFLSAHMIFGGAGDQRKPISTKKVQHNVKVYDIDRIAHMETQEYDSVTEWSIEYALDITLGHLTYYYMDDHGGTTFDRIPINSIVARQLGGPQPVLRSIHLSNNISRVDAYAGCFPDLEEVTFDGPCLINNNAFAHCKKIKYVALPFGTTLEMEINDDSGAFHHYANYIYGVDINADDNGRIIIDPNVHQQLFFIDNKQHTTGGISEKDLNEDLKYALKLELTQSCIGYSPFHESTRLVPVPWVSLTRYLQSESTDTLFQPDKATAASSSRT